MTIAVDMGCKATKTNKSMFSPFYVLYMTPSAFRSCLVLIYWCLVYSVLYGCIIFGMFVICTLFYYVLYMIFSALRACLVLVFLCVLVTPSCLYNVGMFSPFLCIVYDVLCV